VQIHLGILSQCIGRWIGSLVTGIFR
jgi:hypothetical protein